MRIDLFPLALMRIAFAGYALYQAYMAWQHQLYKVHFLPHWSIFKALDLSWWPTFCLVILGGAAVHLLLGFRTRLAAPLTMGLLFALVPIPLRNDLWIAMAFVGWLLVLLPSNVYLSIDAWAFSKAERAAVQTTVRDTWVVAGLLINWFLSHHYDMSLQSLLAAVALLLLVLVRFGKAKNLAMETPRPLEPQVLADDDEEDHDHEHDHHHQEHQHSESMFRFSKLQPAIPTQWGAVMVLLVLFLSLVPSLEKHIQPLLEVMGLLV